MAEKAWWVFAGVLLGAVVVAALARVYPKLGAGLLDADGQREAANALGAKYTDAQLADARAQAALDAQRSAARSESLGGSLGGSLAPTRIPVTLPPAIRRLFPPGGLRI